MTTYTVQLRKGSGEVYEYTLDSATSIEAAAAAARDHLEESLRYDDEADQSVEIVGVREAETFMVEVVMTSPFYITIAAANAEAAQSTVIERLTAEETGYDYAVESLRQYLDDNAPRVEFDTTVVYDS